MLYVGVIVKEFKREIFEEGLVRMSDAIVRI
jgi:hypothetical protein